MKPPHIRGAFVLIGLASFGCGYLSKFSNKPFVDPNFRKEVTIEIKKLDGGLEEVLEKVKFEIEPATVQMEREKKGEVILIANYVSKDEKILLADPSYTNKSLVLDAIDHEVWHAFYDFIGHGNTYPRGFSGPNSRDILRYTLAKIGSEELAPRRETYKKEMESLGTSNLARSEENRNLLNQKYLGADETMARVVDSMYSLYFGPVSDNYFPLEQSDLEFLSQFKCDGSLLFRKGIERYSEGLRLISEGIDPKEVRKSLRNSVTFYGKDHIYDWTPLENPPLNGPLFEN